MNAPDKHWLLVKKYWQPIEELLKEICPDTDVSQEQIDRLNGRLDPLIIGNLHKLRIARNDVIHGNRPLSDELAFENTAISVTKALHALQGRKSIPQRSFESRFQFNLPFWAMTFAWVYVATHASNPSGETPLVWRAAIAIYRPLAWLVKAALDIPYPWVGVPLIIFALGAATSLLPRHLERALRIYILAPLPLAIIINSF